MLENLLSLISLATILLAAFGLGRPLMRRLDVAEGEPLPLLIWSASLGLVLGGVGLGWLGLFGGLHTPLIAVATVIAALWGLCELVRGPLSAGPGKNFESERPASNPSSATHSARQEYADPIDGSNMAPPPRWVLRGCAALVGLVVFGTFLGGLAPPTAGDALCYHLELPKRYLAEHRLVHVPYNDNSTFPLLVEMWFLWGLALDGPVAAQLMHWAAGVLLAGATWLLARPIVGPHWALAAVTAVILAPGISNEMAVPLNDVGLALLTTLGLVAWRQAVVHNGAAAWYILAGLFLGGAAGAKLVGLVFAAALLPHFAWTLWRQPAQRRLLLGGAVAALLVAVATAGLWYGRGAYYTGNPVYPFFCDVFGIDGPDANPATKRPLDAPQHLVTAAWYVTMESEEFGGRGHRPGVLFLACLPVLIFARRLKHLGGLLATCAAFWLLWLVLRQNVRFLFPLVPLASVPLVWSWIELRRFPRPASWAAVAVVAVVLTGYSLLPLVRSASAAAVALGAETRTEYLHLTEPTYFAAVCAHALPADAHILSQEYRTFYFPRLVTREAVFRRETEYPSVADDPHEIRTFFQSHGFTHLLITESDRRGVPYNRVLSKLANGPLAPWLDNVAEYTYRDFDGQVRRYRLVALR